MSIFASLAAPDDDTHTDECARWDKHVDEDGETWEISDRPCNCGQPDAPLVYQGSHVFPSESDPRGGYVDLALIPAHIRFWRDHPNAPVNEEPDGPPAPFLRFGVNGATVILTQRNVEQIHGELSYWLERVQAAPKQDGEASKAAKGKAT